MHTRLVIVGSGTWTDEEVIRMVLSYYQRYYGPALILVLAGGSPGAPRVADRIAGELGIAVERHPTNDDLDGPSADSKRDIRMIGSGVDGCLAFVDPQDQHAWDIVGLAEVADIPVMSFRDGE